jgi:hypothetical protein
LALGVAVSGEIEKSETPSKVAIAAITKTEGLRDLFQIPRKYLKFITINLLKKGLGATMLRTRGRREEGNRIKDFSNLESPSHLDGCYKS